MPQNAEQIIKLKSLKGSEVFYIMYRSIVPCCGEITVCGENFGPNEFFHKNQNSDILMKGVAEHM